MSPSVKTAKVTRALKKATKVKIDPVFVALSPISEENRTTLENAKLILDNPSSSESDRALALMYIKEIYDSDEEHRTLYHYLCACYLLSVHSTENLVTRKMYAKKVENESKKQLKKLSLHMDTALNELNISVQIYEGLKEKAVKAMDGIGEDIRKAIAEGKDVGVLEMVEKETRHVRKKKRVSWGRVDEYSDDGEEWVWRDGMERDEKEDGAVQEARVEKYRDEDEYEDSEDEESEGEEEIEEIEEEEDEN